MLYDLKSLLRSTRDTAAGVMGSGDRLAAGLSVAQRYDGVDWSEWQDPNPEWGALRNLNWVCCRMGDGTHYDPGFAGQWSTMQAQPARYKGWYILPDPRLGVSGQLDYVRTWYARSGVTFGAAGHFYSIDDEPTPSHGQFTGQAMRDFRKGLEDIFQREELHYVGLYSGNYGFIRDEGWQLWAPWPASNGPLPDWTTNLVMWQWGVASAGEVAGFPNSQVDVNTLVDATIMDRLAGYKTGFLMALTDAQQAEMYNKINTIFWQCGNEWPSPEAGARTVGAKATATLGLLEALTGTIQQTYNFAAWMNQRTDGWAGPNSDAALREMRAVVEANLKAVQTNLQAVTQVGQQVNQAGAAVGAVGAAVEKIRLGGIDIKELADEIAARVQYDPEAIADLFASRLADGTRADQGDQQ